MPKRLTAALGHGADTDHEDEGAFGAPDMIRTAAAVLIPIIDQPQPGVILTLRPQWLRSHAGQGRVPRRQSRIPAMLMPSIPPCAKQKKSLG